MATSAKPKRRAAKVDFYWFQGASVMELFSRLNAIGADDARLEVRLAGDKMTLDVKLNGTNLAASSGSPPINDSRRCPPICP